MHLSFRKLRYFAAAADLGNITSAADALNVSQPSVSVAISQLEAELGVQLFVRHHARGVTLTPFGRIVLQHARDLLARIDDFTNAVQGVDNEIRGTVFVGCLNYLMARHFGKILKIFNDEYPDVRINLHDLPQDELIEGVKVGKFDLGFTYDILPEEGLMMTKLLDVRPYILLPSDHSLVNHDSLSLKQLEKENYILFDVPISRRYYQTLFDYAGVKPNITYRTSTIEATRSFVANGLGYSVLIQPIPSLEVYDGRRLARVDIEGTVPAPQIVWIQNSDIALRAVAQLFKDFVVEHFAE